MVIVLWGIFDVPLLLCLVVGICLCLLSVVYVFTLKNNKPAHYDTDFFEAAFVEAGVFELSFGPREFKRRPINPFSEHAVMEERAAKVDARERRGSGSSHHGAQARRELIARAPDSDQPRESKRAAKIKTDEAPQTVPLQSYEKLQAELEMVEEQLTDVLAEHGEI